MELLNLIQKHFPTIGERALQQAIVSKGQVMHFKEGTVIQSFGDYIAVHPLRSRRMARQSNLQSCGVGDRHRVLLERSQT